MILSLPKERKTESHKKQLKALQEDLKNIEKQNFNLPELLKKWMKSEHKQEYNYITTLLHLCAVIPCSTAVVEQSWSVLNLICDKKSNSLDQEHKDELMRICLYRGDFNYEQYIEKWNSLKKRRFGKIGKLSTISECDELSESDSE